MCSDWQEDGTRSSSSMSTSLIDDTSPESAIGKKGKRSPGKILEYIIHNDHQAEFFIYLFIFLQLLRSSCPSLPPHCQTSVSVSLRRGDTLLRRKPPPASAPLHPQRDRPPSHWCVIYRDYVLRSVERASKRAADSRRDRSSYYVTYKCAYCTSELMDITVMFVPKCLQSN